MIKNVADFCARTLTAGAASLFLLGAPMGCASVSYPFGEPPSPLPEEPTEPQSPVNAKLPAISGGTLLITQNNAIAVAADPDRDTVWLVDLAVKKVRASVVLKAGAEPGRVVEDADGQVHVALRRGGAVVKLDPQTGTIVSTRAACPAPRGLAYDAATDNLHVACAGGELVTFKARGGDALRKLQLDRDLRDVVVKGDHLLVSRFRSAELLDLDAAGNVQKRAKPNTLGDAAVTDSMGRPLTASPTTAWRLLSLPGDDTVMLHQYAKDSTLSIKDGGYGGGMCMGGAVATGVSSYRGTMTGSTTAASSAIPFGMAMAVDAAVSRDGQQVALISTTDQAAPFMQSVMVYPYTILTSTTTSGPCVPPLPPMMPPTVPPVQLTAGAFDGAGKLYVQSRFPAQIRVATTGEIITLGDDSQAATLVDEGHRLFHTPTMGMLACASCHPEGGDDGHLWTFEMLGSRRTQSLRGGLLATAPFHWDGDMDNLNTLMTQVFTGRMSGPPLVSSQVDAMGKWLDGQPKLPSSMPPDAAAVERGKTLFHDASIGCASCHSGAHFTNNSNANVGTGKALQVPALTDLAIRAPYLHTGCANTLRDRFEPSCGGGDSHGHTSGLSPSQIDDLVAYLETL